MNLTKFFGVATIVLSTLLPTLSHSARWWNPDDNDYSGGGMDLDSYRTFTDSEGYDVTSMWVRMRMDKADSIYNPNLGKKSITSAATMLIQIRCDTGEIKIGEFIFQDRQYNDLWKISQYPEFVSETGLPFREFYYPSPDSSEEALVSVICELEQLQNDAGVSIQDMQLDDNGHAIGFSGLDEL